MSALKKKLCKEMISSEASKMFIGENICAEKVWAGLERGGCCVLLGCLNHLHGVSSSGCPLASHFALSGFECTFGLTQGPLLYAPISFSQAGF